MPYSTFTFTTYLERAEQDIEVNVQCSKQAYAESRDVPSEFRSRFAGRYDVEVLDVLDAKGEKVETTVEEIDELQSQAFDQLSYH